MSREIITEKTPTDLDIYDQGGYHGNVDISGDARVHLGDVYYQGESRLRFVEGATYDVKGQVPRGCHPETRKDLLFDVKSWAQKADDKRIFWLRGMAGTGKSTISYTVAKWLDEQSLTSCCFVASFFFKRGERDQASASLFFPTIVRQLAVKIPNLKTLVNEAVDLDPDICAKALSEQYNTLLSKPLQKLRVSQGHPIYIIIVDALDECEDDDDIFILLQLLRNLVQSDTLQIRVFLTSRPELSVRLGFAQIPFNAYEDLILHELPPSVIENDIFTFIEDGLVHIRGQYNMVFNTKTLPASWPGSETVWLLTRMANPLFVVASTLCRFIKDRKFHPEERLRQIL